MAYYIISSQPEAMEEFQERIPYLQSGLWLKDSNHLKEVLSTPVGESFFLFHLVGERSEADQMVLIIREKLKSAKILYVVEDKSAHDLKEHQSSTVGGDAYIQMHIDASDLLSIFEGLVPPVFNDRGNRLENSADGSITINSQSSLEDFKNHSVSKELDRIFAEVYGSSNKKPLWQSSAMLIQEPAPEEFEASLDELPPPLEDFEVGVDMSDKDQDLSLDDLDDLELGSDEEFEELAEPEDSGLEMNLGDLDLDLGDSSTPEEASLEDSGMDLNLDEGFSLDEDLSIEEELEEAPSAAMTSTELRLTDDGDEADIDLSDDAMEKLKEIDEIMVHDASQVSIQMNAAEVLSADEGLDFSLDDDIDLSTDLGGELSSDFSSDLDSLETLSPVEENSDSDIDTSLVSDDLDLGSISFSTEDEAPVKEEKSKKKTQPKEKEAVEVSSMGRDLQEISGAYSGEMERMQATLSNLRSDREELLAKIERLEEDKLMQNRSLLTMRAELDERKIELSIVRKKMNDEITNLKDRLKLFEEKKLILEEKNKILVVELDKAGQKNKIDVKKVQMRERELEQKLELLKADSETQIRHRDLKILELKRKLDAMEFDIESISVQEKRSVESRFELEDKLDKAIKTLRNAITVLEDESDNKSGALDALKKNIDM